MSFCLSLLNTGPLDMLIVNDRVRIPLRELDFTFARSSGPGGQNVNKVNTKATLHWDVTHSRSLPDDVRERFVAKYKNRINRDGQVVLSSQRFRDQGRNVADCIARLRELLEEVLQAPKPRKKTKLSQAARGRRLRSKRVTAERKQARRLSAWDED
jgi:ribosome-associated protein